MYVTDLRHLRIISLVSALRMGLVEDVLLDPGCGYVAALRVRPVRGSKQRLVLRQAVRRIGRHAVILNGDEELPDESALDNADRMIALDTLIGLEVVSDEGNLLGRVRNAVIDQETLAIEAFDVARAPLGVLSRLGGMLRIEAREMLSGSKDVIIVPQTVIYEGRDAEDLVPGLPAPPRWRPRPIEVPELQGPDGAGAAMG